ncbi:hypothetical protein [Halodesulfovibrio marinisediminis]|uniref:Uncharacterized protein n=1 Tax=Halodesulfovibrio marinisediminis DSM 17456 TaxID=1121457 RepID=A0A1N6I0J3_9BACT|nr:hypothetical protein [Halodesulfovibrio marinisediminis]SIO25572.1 hypothetical protein SAMN02745161_2323 [Halodesulfovibrio marinisediminis DSM 17456]
MPQDSSDLIIPPSIQEIAGDLAPDSKSLRVKLISTSITLIILSQITPAAFSLPEKTDSLPLIIFKYLVEYGFRNISFLLFFLTLIFTLLYLLEIPQKSVRLKRAQLLDQNTNAEQVTTILNIAEKLADISSNDLEKVLAKIPIETQAKKQLSTLKEYTAIAKNESTLKKPSNFVNEVSPLVLAIWGLSACLLTYV